MELHSGALDVGHCNGPLFDNIFKIGARKPFCGENGQLLNLWTVTRNILWTVRNIFEGVGAQSHRHEQHAMFWLSSVGQVKQHVVAPLRDLTCPSLSNFCFGEVSHPL
jgi:hypothetical protein